MGNFNLDTDEQKEWYSISTNRSSEHLGDCLELMPLIADESIDMILCDLPYGTTILDWDKTISAIKLWEQYERIIKPNGAIVLFASQPFTSALVMSNPKLFRYEFIWEKTKPTGFQNARKMPLKIHENILVFYKKLPTFNQLHLKKLDKPVKSGRKNKGSNHKCCANGDSNYMITETNFQNSMLKFSNPSGAGHLHPTQKPLPILTELIQIYTNKGEVVLDNTAGVFSTALACLETNRKYIVMEKEKEYYNKGIKRILEWQREQKTKLL